MTTSTAIPLVPTPATPAPVPRSILDCFPTNSTITKPRSSQKSVLEAIQKAFAEGYRNVLLEAPVGSGKSAIATAAAIYYGGAHILTPRKSLQNQYVEDFAATGMVLMKGRNAFPCTFPSSGSPEYKRVVRIIEEGGILPTPSRGRSCSDGPCKGPGGRGKGEECMQSLPNGSKQYPCPYHVAMGKAISSPMVVHNLHSFIFQSSFAGNFGERELLVIDECHEMEGVIRSFEEKKVPVKVPFDDWEAPSDAKTLDHWVDFMERNYASLHDDTAQVKDPIEDVFARPGEPIVTERDKFLERLQVLLANAEAWGEEFAVSVSPFHDYTLVTFIPKKVGNTVKDYLLDFGKKRLLMSGTIYNKSLFCRNNGLVEEETCFLRIGSTFPVDNRPIYFKDDYKVDTSHRMWDVNFAEMVEKIKKVMEVFDDAKGLIHTPSYKASAALYQALRSTGRVVMHDNFNFLERLEEFYNSEEPNVFLSPVCQQGVDFKHDRARFQIILRVPYLNTGDAFAEYLVKKDFPAYNHQALVTFGQQIGRINRAEDDFGVTILMDERFGNFLSRNKKILPKWLTDAVIYK